jgi:addiction module RelE/StbE family toxin
VKIQWTKPALDDLSAIRAHIRRDNPQAAQEVARRLLYAVAMLVEHPGAGRPGRLAETRELVVPRTPYLIPYLVRNAEIQILRVLHGARDWPSEP